MSVNLKPVTVATLKPREKPYYVVDTTKLALRVAPSGEKSWSVRYRVGRHQRRLTLGGYPTLSLADARKMARNALKTVAKGSDPAETKQERRTADDVETFAQIYIAKYAK
jgi:hypothetical protein